MEEATIKKGYRNAWILIALAIFFVVASFWFTVDRNTPAHEEQWNMGGQQFVPASSPYANGYYTPLTEQNRKGPKP